MATTDDIHPGFIGLLVAVIVFLVGIFGMLFAPSAPTSHLQTTTIPLDNASTITSPSQLQGNASANPQDAAKIQPGSLDTVNP